MTTTVTVNAADNLFQRTIAVAINVNGIGGKRKVSLDNVEVDADKDRLALVASVLQCGEHDAIKRLFTAVRQSMANPLRGLALPTVFKRSVYVIPTASVPQVEAMLVEYRETLRGLISDLKAVYPQRIEEDRVKLREKFNRAHYPDVDSLDATFSIEWRYLSIGPTAQLREISADIYAQEVQRVRREVTEMGEEVKSALRSTALELVRHMSARLGKDADGKLRVFRRSTVTNLVQFLTSFEGKNIMGDVELGQILTRMRDVLSGVDAEILRSDEDFRAQLKNRVDAIIPELDALVQVGGRQIILPDEEPEAAPAAPEPTPIASGDTCKKHRGEAKPCARCKAEGASRRTAKAQAA